MENYILGGQGNYALGYRLIMPEKYSLGQDDYDALNEYFSKVLRDLPTNSIFFKQDIFLEENFSTENYPERNFLERATKKYFNKLPFNSHITNLFFILPNKSIEWKKLKNPLRKPNKKQFIEFDEKIEAFNTSVKQAINYIKTIKLSGGVGYEVEPLNRDYLNEYKEYLLGGINKNYSVDIKNEWDYLRVGEQFASILKFPMEDKFPENLNTCRIDSSLSNDTTKFYKNYGDNFGFDLDFTHIYNQIAVIDDPKKHYDNAVKNNDNLVRFKRFDRTNTYWAERTDEMLKEMANNADNERVIRGHNNIVIFASDKTELKLRIDKVVNSFKDIDIRPERAFGDNLMALYEYSYPLNADLFVPEHYYISPTNVYSAFMLPTGLYKDDKEGIRFNSRINSMKPVIIDVWDDYKKYMSARNFVILSPTGGGKSFLANHIITHFYQENTKQVIVDLGGSYRKLASLFPNDIAYVTYEEGKSLGINPFDLKSNEDITTAKIDELVEFVAVHYKRDSLISEAEKASLRKIIDLYYKNISKGHSLPDFVKRFIEEKDEIVKHLEIKPEFFNVDEFELLMSEFIDNGAYAFLYDETKENFGAGLQDKKIIVFELDNLRKNPFLLTILLQLISTTIDKVVWEDKSTRGVIWFDEFAKQLKWDGVLGRIEYYYQAIRKQNGSIGLVLQTINQLPENNPLAQAIVENTQVLYVIQSKKYRDIQKRYDLSEHAYYEMTSIRNDFKADRPYSEVFILRGSTHQVYRLEVPKEVFWAYQTDGTANNILMEIYDHNKDMETSIHTMIDNEKEILSIADQRKSGFITDEQVKERLKKYIN